MLLESELFDPAFYLDTYPDVARAGVDPVDHYLWSGATEGRRPHPLYDADWYRRNNPDVGDANPLIHYLEAGRREGRRIQKPVVVYTAIIGGYDRLRTPTHPDPDIDYIVFADDLLVQVPSPWIRLRSTHRFGDDRRTSRYYKTHPHELFPGYEFSVWIDGAFQLRNLTTSCLEPALGSNDIAFFRHPWRDCVYEEATVVMQHQLDSPERIATAIDRLREHRYPEHAGLIECGFIVRRQGVSSLATAMEEWWQMILNGSQRDQLSINLALWKHQIRYSTIPGSSRRNQWVYWMGHRATRLDDVEKWSQFLENEILDLQAAIENCSAKHS